jgi:TetR/AcrR family transcriptional repressor of nem operon
MTRTETRKHLIDVGTCVISEQGFNPTGLNLVLQTAGVPKGSFYYYFASKEDFGLAIIDETAAEYSELIDSFFTEYSAFANNAYPPLSRSRLATDRGGSVQTRLSDWHTRSRTLLSK